jgi:hypothetical protein
MASRNGNSHHRSGALRSVFLALLVTTPVVSVTMTSAASSEASRPSQPTRFSNLAELTPANVHSLLPLVSRDIAAKFDEQGALLEQHSLAHPLQVDSLAGANLPLQRFLDQRVRLQLAIEQPARLASPAGASGCEVSYLIDTPEATAAPVTGVPGERELRAWDPIERRVVWSVTEALPVAARTLITAGGLVFYGTSDGWIKALDARTGRTLWKHRAEGRVLDEPFSYRGADGHQYIGVHSLPHAPAGGREALLIFTLPH